MVFMKKIFVISIMAACMFAANAHAQDIISMRNGQTVKAKVTEVNETSVKYSLFDEPDGPVYTVGKDDISSIEYKSGRVETFVRSSSYADAFYGSDGRRVPEGVVPGMRYKDYAKLYDPKDYVKRVDDRYSPVWGGVASAIIPGLGQMINGQVGRGFAFLGIEAGCAFVSMVGMGLSEESDAGVIIYLLGAAGSLATDIWAIVDGVRVAKIKNLYTRDTSGMASIDLKMEPFLAMTAPSVNGQSPVAGMKLSISF